ncbi:MAG: hypothetical protein IT450_16090 [Phycisphaerales bacterium]|nr:hypothetical protein [Phycisphaerales bacterium]
MSNVIGATDSFAIEWSRHPDSGLAPNESFGMFRYWISGRVFGRPETDATCHLEICDQLRRVFADRRSPFPSQRFDNAPAMDVLREYFRYARCDALARDQPESRQYIGRIHDHVLSLAGEAFDDDSWVVKLDVGGRVRVLGVYLAPPLDQERSAQELSPEWVSGPCSEVELDAHEFYARVEQCLREIEPQSGDYNAYP